MLGDILLSQIQQLVHRLIRGENPMSLSDFAQRAID